VWNPEYNVVLADEPELESEPEPEPDKELTP
jgi:hypothetical protein